MKSIKWFCRKPFAVFGDPYLWLLILSAFISLSRLYDHSLFSIFQERDIGRALELSKGHMIFFGPEVIGGGHLPGPFYYMLLALPLSLGFGATGCWYLMTAMASLAVGFTYSGLRRFLSLEISVLAASTLICVPQFGKIITFFQNYSFMPLLIVLSLGSLAVSYVGEGEKRKRAWLMTSILFALAIQLHMSVIFIMFAALFIQILGPRIGISRLPLKTFLLGLTLFLMVVAPYYIWVICRDNGYVFGQIPPAFVSINPANYLSFKRTIGNYPTENIFEIISTVVHDEDVWTAFAQMLSYSALAIVLVLKFFKPDRSDAAYNYEDAKLTQAFRIWLTVVLFTILPAITVLIQPHRARYFSVFLFASCFCIAAWAEGRYRLWPQARQSILLLAFSLPIAIEILIRIGNVKALSMDKIVYLALLCATTFLFFKVNLKRRWILALPLLAIITMMYRHSDDSRGRKGFMLTTARALSDSVIRATGWNWKEARSRFFTLNVQYQRSFGSIYQERFIELQKSPSWSLEKAPDGYFIKTLSEQPETVSREEFKKRLLKTKLPKFLAKGLREGEIIILQPEILPYGILAGYRVLDKLKYPPSFQNVGVNYLASAGTNKDPKAEKISGSAGPQLATVSRMPSSEGSESALRFTFNDCPNGHAFCDIHFDVTRRQGTDQLKVVISGDVISQTSPWVSPDWLQEIFDSYLRFTCESGPRLSKIQLFSTIGVNRSVFAHRVLSQNILGPAERWILNPCASSSIAKIEAGFRKSLVTVSRSTFYLDGRMLESAGF